MLSAFALRRATGPSYRSGHARSGAGLLTCAAARTPKGRGAVELEHLPEREAVERHGRSPRAGSGPGNAGTEAIGRPARRAVSVPADEVEADAADLVRRQARFRSPAEVLPCCPRWSSYSSFWPSCGWLIPARSTSEMWRKTSFEPSSGWRKP